MSDVIQSHDVRRGRSGFSMTVAVYLSMCSAMGVEPRAVPDRAVTARVWDGHVVEWLDDEGMVVR